MKILAAFSVFLISISAIAGDSVATKVVEFKGLGWTELYGGHEKQSYELGDACWDIPTIVKGKHFRFPTKDELKAVLRAGKLSIIGQPYEYGIWTSTKEDFTHRDGSVGQYEVRCTREGSCDNNPHEPGATSSRSVSIEADVVCVIELENPTTSSAAKPVAKKDSKSGTGKQPALVLTQRSTTASDTSKTKAAEHKVDKGYVCPEDNRMFTSADLAANCGESAASARAKATAEAQKKANEDHKKGLALAQKSAADEKEKIDKEAKRKAEGWIVNTTEYGDSLEEHQAKTWCQRKVPEFQKTMATSENKLISMGACSCKPGGAAVTLNKLYRCEFSVSYRAFKTNAR